MGVACDAKLGPLSTSPLPLNCLSVLDDGRAGGPPLFWGVSPQCLSCKFNRELLHQSISCSYSLILNLSTSSLSLPPYWADHPTAHTSYRWNPCHPSSAATGFKHSLQIETWTTSFLGGHSVWVATLFFARAFCLMEEHISSLPIAGGLRLTCLDVLWNTVRSSLKRDYYSCNCRIPKEQKL